MQPPPWGRWISAMFARHGLRIKIFHYTCSLKVCRERILQSHLVFFISEDTWDLFFCAWWGGIVCFSSWWNVLPIFFFEGKCATNNIFFENSVLPIIDKHPFHVSTSLPIIGEQLMGLFSYWMISRRTVGELSFWTYSYYCFSSLITRNPFFPKKASLPPKRTKLNTQTYVGMSHKVENVSYFIWTAKVNSQIRPLFTMMTISPRDITPKIHNFSRVMTGKKIQMASLLLEANENTFWFFFGSQPAPQFFRRSQHQLSLSNSDPSLISHPDRAHPAIPTGEQVWWTGGTHGCWAPSKTGENLLRARPFFFFVSWMVTCQLFILSKQRNKRGRQDARRERSLLGVWGTVHPMFRCVW